MRALLIMTIVSPPPFFSRCVFVISTHFLRHLSFSLSCNFCLSSHFLSFHDRVIVCLAVDKRFIKLDFYSTEMADTLGLWSWHGKAEMNIEVTCACRNRCYVPCSHIITINITREINGRSTQR